MWAKSYQNLSAIQQIFHIIAELYAYFDKLVVTCDLRTSVTLSAAAIDRTPLFCSSHFLT